MWKAVRNGDPGGYAYLGWMHHNGHIGGHLPPHTQPRLPDGGAHTDDRAANKRPGWTPDPRSEEDLLEAAVAYWGEARVGRSNAGRGVGTEDGGGAPGGRGGGGLGRFWQATATGGGDGGSGGGGGGRRRGPDGEGYVKEGGGGGGESMRRRWEEGDDGDGHGGPSLRPGEDVWGGTASEESWPWETIGGGVSGAIAAADLYLEGFRVRVGFVAGCFFASAWTVWGSREAIERETEREGEGSSEIVSWRFWLAVAGAAVEVLALACLLCSSALPSGIKSHERFDIVVCSHSPAHQRHDHRRRDYRYQAGDAACGTALGDMWLNGEYSDTRDGRGAGGKWAMLQAYILYQKALVGFGFFLGRAGTGG